MSLGQWIMWRGHLFQWKDDGSTTTFTVVSKWKVSEFFGILYHPCPWGECFFCSVLGQVPAPEASVLHLPHESRFTLKSTRQSLLCWAKHLMRISWLLSLQVQRPSFSRANVKVFFQSFLALVLPRLLFSSAFFCFASTKTMCTWDCSMLRNSISC